jgi:hypothetical protein
MRAQNGQIPAIGGKPGEPVVRVRVVGGSGTDRGSVKKAAPIGLHKQVVLLLPCACSDNRLFERGRQTAFVWFVLSFSHFPLFLLSIVFSSLYPRSK